MSTSPMRDALLAQSGPPQPTTELQLLTSLMAAEHRRARRLSRATIAVWIIWMLCVAAMFTWPMLAARSPGDPPSPPPGPFLSAIVFGVTIMMLFGAMLLPALGIILLILSVFSRRSSSIAQLRASVAAMELQLKALTAQNAGATESPRSASRPTGTASPGS